MPSLADLYRGPSRPPAWTLGQLALDESDLREDTAVSLSRLYNQYSQRDLPGLVNRYASRGTFFGGQSRLAADRLREDVNMEQGDLNRLMARRVAEIQRQRTFAPLGWQV